MVACVELESSPSTTGHVFLQWPFCSGVRGGKAWNGGDEQREVCSCPTGPQLWRQFSSFFHCSQSSHTLSGDSGQDYSRHRGSQVLASEQFCRTELPQVCYQSPYEPRQGWNGHQQMLGLSG